MTITSRWVRYPVAGTTEVSAALPGERGNRRGTAAVSDMFSIGSNNQIRVDIDAAGAQQITLTSGTNLDPRFVAKDIQRKLQAFGASLGDAYKFAQVEFSNYKSGDGLGHFIIRSGTTGGTSAVALSAGDSDATTVLGFASTAAEQGTSFHTGTSTANSGDFTGTVTVSGTYAGAFDDEYYVIVNGSEPIVGTPGGGNTFAGTVTYGGDWNHDSACAYTVTIDTANGEVMNAGTGNVPTFTVVDAGTLNDNVATPQELLYSDTWYYVGTNGARIRFSDSQFGDGDTFDIACTPGTDSGAGSATGAVSACEYVYKSHLGDDSDGASPCSTTPVPVGTKGVNIFWSDSGVLTVKDAWRVICQGPTPEAYGVTSVNYGNVTVTTSAPVKVHQFELVSGARQVDNIKFSLYSHGTFNHHNSGDDDTQFRFGTVGFGNRGDRGGVANSGPEWASDITAADISVDKVGGDIGSPLDLWASKANLGEVVSADNAEDVGNMGLASDFIYTTITLGANETGANSGIVYRLYFDYS